MSHKILPGLCLALFLLFPVYGRANTGAVVDTSYSLSGGEKVMELSIVIPAPLAETWNMFTTSEGYASWAAPFAVIDLRVGGQFETSYSPEAKPGARGNIKNKIIALVPLRLIVIQNVQAPLKTAFDVPTFQQLQTAILFTAVSERETRVTLQNPGYLSGEKFDTVYKFFQAGNGWTLMKFRERFEKGPTAWAPPNIGQDAASPAAKAH